MKTPFITLSLALGVAFGASAQAYTYLPESFEGSEWTTKGTTVTSSTGLWTTNNNISDQSTAQDGSSSILIAQKVGLMSPELIQGVGAMVYWEKNTNRTVTIEVSVDGQTWDTVESYRETGDWTKHTVEINNPKVRWVSLSLNSNKNYYIDNVLFTRPDGTDANGNMIVTTLTLPYWTNDFESSTTYPQSKNDATSEKTFNVDGQGEWRYLNAYKNTNESYIPDGSARGLRLLKNNSYVVTPVVSQGVVRVKFDGGRINKKLVLYTSTDEGATWTLAKNITTDADNSIYIGEQTVNRVKLVNESSSDIDIDNLSLTAFPMGTPATVITGEASDITSSKAMIALSVADQGTSEVFEKGICWIVGEDAPAVDNATTVKATGDNVELTGLPCSSTVKYRAYAISLAGVGYGEVKEFVTAAPSAPVVSTLELTPDDARSDETQFVVMAKGTVIDNGGMEPSEAGFEVKSPSETVSVKALLSDNNFSAYISLKPETAYEVRAYATNSIGTAYGDVIAYTTGSIVIPDYAHNVYYCAPDGDDATADGSEAKPFRSLQKAVDIVVPGDTIYMLAGTYEYGQRINISRHGEKGSGMIALFAKGGRAVLDFSQMATADANQGIRMTSSFWHVYGLDIAGAGDNGMLIERNKPTGGSYSDIAANTDQAHDNIIELCNFYRCKDTGLQLKNLAAYNKIINCDSYFNCDPGEGNADGFAVKLSHGEGNYFYGCRAWNNSDDGWDQFIKKEGGFPDDITTTLEYCWAFRNGYLENDQACSGNGNGFKMGSNQGRNNVILNRCMAFENLNKGFDQNHNTGHMILNNCTGYSTKDLTGKSRYSYRLDEETASGHIIRLTNCVAISDGIADRKKSEYAPHSVVGELITTDLNRLPADFLSVDWSGTKGERQADGSLPELDFMRPTEGNNALIDKGSLVTPFDGESRWAEGITYYGTAPDLGAWETGAPESGICQPEISADKRVTIHPTATGLLLVDIIGASATDTYNIWVYDLAGHLMAAKTFTGPTTVIAPRVHGVSIVTLTGNNLKHSTKVKL